MNVVKSMKEFQDMKDDITKKLKEFVKSYEDFSRSVSPKDWRGSGSFFSIFDDLERTIQNVKPLEYKDLEDEFIRKQILTTEEQELYNDEKKYNL